MRLPDLVTLCVASATLGLLTGCMPRATVDIRSLRSGPVPPGRMAMLPPVLLPAVQYADPAQMLPRQLISPMRKAGLDVVYETLDDRLQPRTAATRPAGGEDGLPAATWVADDRCVLLAQAGYRTAIQPAIRRYGYYPAYIPGRMIAVEEPPIPFDYGGSPYDWPDPFPGKAYALVPLPRHYDPAAQVEVEFRIFDVQARQPIYSITVGSSGVGRQPVQLEHVLVQPLVKAMRKAMRAG